MCASCASCCITEAAWQLGKAKMLASACKTLASEKPDLFFLRFASSTELSGAGQSAQSQKSSASATSISGALGHRFAKVGHECKSINSSRRPTKRHRRAAAATRGPGPRGSSSAARSGRGPGSRRLRYGRERTTSAAAARHERRGERRRKRTRSTRDHYLRYLESPGRVSWTGELKSSKQETYISSPPAEHV